MKTDMKFLRKVCYVVVNLLEKEIGLEDGVNRSKDRNKIRIRSVAWKGDETYSHSGDDGKEDPPVPIPNTEVKLFNAESTYG